MEAKASYLFEVSWEVCNKVGGIYTVLESKAALMKEAYKNYTLIGPYFPDKAKLDFIEEPLPKTFDQITKTLEQEGILIHYGTWQIKGKPKSNCNPMAIPSTSARSQAAMAISARIQRMKFTPRR